MSTVACELQRDWAQEETSRADDHSPGISREALDRIDPALRGAVHRGSRCVDRQRRPAEHRQGPGLLGGESAVGRERVRDRLRRLPAARRTGCRPARQAASLHGRPDRGRGRIARRGLRGHPGTADRGPRRSGPGRGDRLPGSAVDRHLDVQGRRRAQQGPRGVGRRGGLGRGGGSAARRHPHRVAWLGVGPLGQRPGSGDRAGIHPRADPGEPLGVGHAPLRRGRSRQHHGRSLPAGVHAPGCEQLRLGLHQDRQPAGCVGGPDRNLRRNRAPLEGTAGSLQDLPPEDADRGKRLRSAAWRLAVLDVLFHLPVHAAGARLQRDSRRPVVPAAGADDHHRGGPRWPTRHPVRLQADPGERPRLRLRSACSGSARCPSGADSSPTFSARRSSRPLGSDSGS